MSIISVISKSIFKKLSDSKFPEFINTHQIFVFRYSRSRQNFKNKVGPILWDTLYLVTIHSNLVAMAQPTQRYFVSVWEAKYPRKYAFVDY